MTDRPVTDLTPISARDARERTAAARARNEANERQRDADALGNVYAQIRRASGRGESSTTWEAPPHDTNAARRAQHIRNSLEDAGYTVKRGYNAYLDGLIISWEAPGAP